MPSSKKQDQTAQKKHSKISEEEVLKIIYSSTFELDSIKHLSKKDKKLTDLEKSIISYENYKENSGIAIQYMFNYKRNRK